MYTKDYFLSVFRGLWPDRHTPHVRAYLRGLLVSLKCYR